VGGKGPDHLDLGVARLRGASRASGQDDASGGFGVDHV
jgi:hypothetical protein